MHTKAARVGIAPSAAHKIREAHGLKAHLTRTFKLSRDRDFIAKVQDIVGLYLNLPTKALMLWVDGKSQIQALDRTQPGLPMKKGRCGTMTHDHKHSGTTPLFAAVCRPEPSSRSSSHSATVTSCARLRHS